MKARKGDLFVYSTLEHYTIGQEATSVYTKTEFHIAVVESATREGLVKSIRQVYAGYEGSPVAYVSGVKGTPLARVLRLQNERYVLPLSEGWKLSDVLSAVNARIDVPVWRRATFASAAEVKELLRPIRPAVNA